MLYDATKIPKPDNEFESGKLYDGSGHTIPQKTEAGWMVKLNEKASEDVTLKKGTLWLLGAGVVILNLLFSYGGSFVSWVRTDQNRTTQAEAVQRDVGELRKDMEKLQVQISDMQKAMVADQLQRAKIEGFKAGVAETQSDHK